MNAFQIKAECAAKALEDAGFEWKDVDGVFDVVGGGAGGMRWVEYLGFKPNILDTTSTGGSSPEYGASHALKAIIDGRCSVALVTHGGTPHSDRVAIGTAGGTGGGEPNLFGNMEDPWGMTLISNYAMVKTRHMYQYGTTMEQFAALSVVTRRHAMRNPESVRTMTDLQFEDIREITVEDVLESRMVAHPLHLLECCLISDGGGAFVIANKEMARNSKRKPVWIIGTGEGVKYRENGGDITIGAGAQAGALAFAEAEIKPSEIDSLMVYDSFTSTDMLMIEDLGFCKKGEGGPFVENSRLQLGKGSLPINTDGGGLSSNHPGMRGIFLLIEATKQLRHERGTMQVPNCEVALCHGTGGALGSRHSGSTIVLGRG
jgi:acetyl-CoA C-acetyltransferase